MTPLEVLDAAFPPDEQAPALAYAEADARAGGQAYRDRIEREAEWRRQFGDETAERLIHA